MDLKQAKQILTGMGLDEFNGHKLFMHFHIIEERYLSATTSLKTAVLDGGYTADELEAIATWIRDPSGVVGAE